jgi:hypothetical protein
MIPKGGNRFSDKTMLNQKDKARAFSLLMESEARLYDFVLTRFLHANRYPLRSKTL